MTDPAAADPDTPSPPASRADASPAERAADAVCHFLGVAAALAGSGWLIVVAALSAAPLVVVGLVVYAVGMICSFASSAAYNLSRPGRAKEALRRLDHAMIFLMIAGSYTPFALLSLDGTLRVAILAVVWTAAAVGMAVKILFPRRLERTAMVLYLAMGWVIVFAFGPLAEALSTPALALLVLGGVVYSLGALVYARGRWRFNRAAWHAMVLAAASLHYAAIAIEYTA